MFNYRTAAVIKREVKDKVLSKSFLISTLLIPCFLFGLMALQTYLIRFAGESEARLQIISGEEALTEAIRIEMNGLDAVKNGEYRLEYRTMDKKSLEEHLRVVQKELLNEKLTAVLYVPGKTGQEKPVEYYSKNPNNLTVFNKLRNPVNRALTGYYLRDRGLTGEDLAYAGEGVDFTGYRVSEKEGIAEEGYGNTIISFLFSFLLYFSLLMLGTMMLRSVVEEKNNRIVELLLSSVRSRELMTGKILGVSIMGVLQMAIWLLPVMVLVTTSLFTLPPEFILKLDLLQIGYFLLNFFIGLITFMGLFATVGAIFDNDQDAQSGMWPIMMLIMIPSYIAFSAGISGPGSAVVRISSMLPLASIMVMPARMTLVEVPLWQLLLSFCVNIGTMMLLFLLSGKIYRTGILMTGKKPKWSDVLRWLRAKS